MKAKDVKDFIPDKELLKFAEDFSGNYKVLSSGTYTQGKYRIDYKNKIIDEQTGKESGTDARIDWREVIIELSKTKLSNEKYTSDYVFYIIIWCVIMGDVKDNTEADLTAIKYYMTTGRPMKNLVFGILQCFSDGHLINVERYKKIDAFINNNKSKI